METGNPEVETGNPEVKSGNPEVKSGNPEMKSGNPEMKTGNPDLETGNPDVGSMAPKVQIRGQAASDPGALNQHFGVGPPCRTGLLIRRTLRADTGPADSASEAPF